MADTDAEREEFQRRSDTYEPNVQGPLISEKKSISDLLVEYEHSDQIFITKLTALSRDHPTWRAIKRDGKCGWTASIFAYFENLLLLPAAKIQAEITRLRSFDSMISDCGYALDTLDFMMDETYQLMQHLHDHLLHGTAAAHLLEVFNNEEQYVPNCVIYHFKLMTSAYMQANADPYSNYVQEPLDLFCRNHVEPQNQEIEYASLHALAAGVIGPAGINFKVLYLDRSGDGEVGVYPLGQCYSASSLLIEVLYRPGHYDLIYKDGTATVQDNYQPVSYVSPQICETPNFDPSMGVLSVLATEGSTMPGYDSNRPTYGGYSNLNHCQGVPNHDITNPSIASISVAQGNPYVPPHWQEVLTCAMSNASSSSTPVIQDASHAPNGSPSQWQGMPGYSMSDGSSPATVGSQDSLCVMDESSDHRSVMADCSVSGGDSPNNPVIPQPLYAQSCTSPNNDPIRFNYYTYQAGTDIEPPFSTGPFKNSVFNHSHFSNTSFHPQEYRPDFQCPRRCSRNLNGSTKSSNASKVRTGRQNAQGASLRAGNTIRKSVL